MNKRVLPLPKRKRARVRVLPLPTKQLKPKPEAYEFDYSRLPQDLDGSLTRSQLIEALESLQFKRPRRDDSYSHLHLLNVAIDRDVRDALVTALRGK